MPDWKQEASIATGIVLGSLILGVLGSFGLKGAARNRQQTPQVYQARR